MAFVFWLSVVGILYAYVGYPVVLVALKRFRPAPVQRSFDTELPSVTLLIPAHNEGANIANKIHNSLALDYPSELLQVVTISDGSTDDTVQQIEAFADDPRIELLVLEERSGKGHALNRGLERARGEIIVFTDASIELQTDSLRALVADFADPEVGCVSGEDHIRDGSGEGLYGKYELWLRNLESEVGSIVGASGSIYAQRRHLVKGFREGLAPDFLSVLETVEEGYRCVSEPNALGYMKSVKSAGAEFARKKRTLVRGMVTLIEKSPLLNPSRYGMFAFCLISHKLIRWLVPFFMLLAFISNLLLVGSAFYGIVFALQILFYLVATLTYFEISGLQERSLPRVILFFCASNLAIGFAWLQALRGTRLEIWEPSKRT